LGHRGERLAESFLIQRGYRIEARNVRFPVGELDLVARCGETLCFIEVRSASSVQWGGALESVTWKKRRRMIRAASWYLRRLKTLPLIRFDVVAIQWDPSSRPSIELIQDAFRSDGTL